MIKVNHISLIDEVYYFNPDRLIGIYVENRTTCLDFGTGHDVEIEETPETVARLITEYKQRQMRLQAAYGEYCKLLNDEYTLTSLIEELESEDRGE